jgi:hypothetical protein
MVGYTGQINFVGGKFMKKRILSLALALTFVLAFIPAAATAAADYTVLVPFGKYEWIENFSGGVAVVEDKNGRIGLIDATGKEIVPLGKYDRIRDFSGGAATVIRILGDDYIYGAIDTTGKEIVPLGKYEYIDDFSNGVAVAWDDDWKDGVIDATGKVIVPFGKFALSKALSSDVFVILDDDWEYVVIDAAGKVLVPPGKFEWIESYSDGVMVAVNEDWEDGVIDITGKVIVPFGKYGRIGAFNDGAAVVRDDDYNSGVIDATGKLIVPFGKYEWIDPFSNGVAAVTVWDTDVKFGLIDATGKEVFPLRAYDDLAIWSFYNGAAKAIRGGEYGLIRINDYAPPAPTLANFTKTRTYNNNFPDLTSPTAQTWVPLAFEYGLMSGGTDGTFGSMNHVTIEQVLVVASRVHMVYNTGVMTDPGSMAGWRSYALDNKIIDNRFEGGYGNPATRAEVAYIMGNILEDKDMKPNTPQIFAFTDVPVTHKYYADVKRFFEAGMISGFNADTFNPDGLILREQCAVMFVRVVDQASRR